MLLSRVLAECRYDEWHYAESCHAECHYAECHYADCHYAECHGAFFGARVVRNSDEVSSSSSKSFNQFLKPFFCRSFFITHTNH
jgi:hypothetical protein